MGQLAALAFWAAFSGSFHSAPVSRPVVHGPTPVATHVPGHAVSPGHVHAPVLVPAAHEAPGYGAYPGARPMTRQAYRQQIAFWNDRADLARLYDLEVTFEGWRFFGPQALVRLDARVMRFLGDELAEADREGFDRAATRQIVAEYRLLMNRSDPASLTARRALFDRMIALEQAEIRRDAQVLRQLGWADPGERRTW